MFLRLACGNTHRFISAPPRRHRNSYTLVLHKHGELLYEGVCEVVAAQLNGTTQSVLDAHADLLLDRIVEAWNYHKLIMTMIRDILMYMVRVSIVY
jgi:cullin 3